jgi:hypothetical protein
MGLEDKTLLDRLAAQLASERSLPERYLFSRAGFDAPLRHAAAADAGCHLIAAGDLCEP